MTEFHASVTFCDDVRHEVGGKVSVIGMYRGFLGAALRGALPKLVALVLIDYPLRAVGVPTRFAVMDRDRVLAEVQAELLSPAPLPDQAIRAGVPRDVVQATIPIELIGVTPEDGMRLRVEIENSEFSYASEELIVFLV